MTLAVFHHRCGKREVCFPSEQSPPCKDCDRIREDVMRAVTERTKARMTACFSPRKFRARYKGASL